MADNPYTRRWEEYDSEHYLPISVSYGKPIYVTKDGKIKARGFVDINDDLELFIENDQVKSRYVVADGIIKNFSFKHVDEYVYTLTMYDELKECFQTYLNPVHLIDNRNDNLIIKFLCMLSLFYKLI